MVALAPRPRECALTTVATNQLLAATGEEGGGFHPPSIAEFFPASFLFEGTPFEMNRIILVRLVAAAVVVVLFVIAARRAQLVPGRGQNLAEMGLDFVRVNIAEETLGHNARRFLPMLTTIFFAVLFMNLTGVVPFLNIASTSLIGMPIVLALWVYVMYIGVGVRKFGVGGYLKNNLLPPGLPKPLYVLVTPIEALQVFLFRPATLALRLTANMIAGHLILVLCFGATHYFLFEAGGALKIASVFGLVAGLAFTLFEVLVAALQAYIFTLLSAVYLNMAVEEEH
ncbi:F0F1 ATP synthase subunit A [Cellulomonas carbonis]|uniref:ATP synthase subunit a n=1 Tax=Cellulomonas carbonis T26 TaxID=947969 RepID=A0A0A0BS69_9CELL|nr:F0F1 ATP synthase subunit A [Cellulomonas carbonis]KGM10740.1 ATP synthase F0F1 subunit A [Cellulomonas carbonis T26]GGC12034.1 ATP synthase subunit a [Cellulomonas carbonis]